MSTPEISCSDLKQLLDDNANVTVIDVRGDDELEISKIDCSVHIPLGEIEARIGELDKNQAYVMQCRTGGRSGQATRILIENGFSNVRNLVGGINEWAMTIDTELTPY